MTNPVSTQTSTADPADIQALSDLESAFYSLDANQNGTLSQAELQEADNPLASPEAFARIDAMASGAADGEIGRTDLQLSKATLAPEFDPAKNPLDEHGASFLAARYFNTWDGSANQDHDGLIDRGEMHAVANNTDAPTEQRYAARYLLDHEDVFAKLDTRDGENSADGAIGDGDIENVVGDATWTAARSYTEGPVRSEYADTPSRLPIDKNQSDLIRARDAAIQAIDAELAKIQTTGDLDTPGALSGAIQLVLDKWRPESTGDTIHQAIDTVESGLDNADRAQFGKALEHLRWAFEHNDIDEVALKEAVIQRNTAQTTLDNPIASEGLSDLANTHSASPATAKADQRSRNFLEEQISQHGAPLSSDYVLGGLVATGQIKDPANLTASDLAKVQALSLRLAEDAGTDDPALKKAAQYIQHYDPQLKDKSTDEIIGKDLHQRLRWESGLEQSNAVEVTHFDYMSFLSGGDEATDAQLFYYNSVANQLKADHPALGQDKYGTESAKPVYSFSATCDTGGWEDTSDDDFALTDGDLDFLYQYTSDHQLDLSNGDDIETLQNAWRDHRFPPGSNEDFLHDWVDLEASAQIDPAVGQKDNLLVLADAAIQANRAFDEHGKPLVMNPYAMAAQMAARTDLSFDDQGIPSISTLATSMSDRQAIERHSLAGGNQLWDTATLFENANGALQGMAAEVAGIDPNRMLSTAGSIALGIACPLASLVVNALSKPHFNEKQQWVHDQLESAQKSTDVLDATLRQARGEWGKNLLIESVTMAAASAASIAGPAVMAARNGLLAAKAAIEIATDVGTASGKSAANAAGEVASPGGTLGSAAGSSSDLLSEQVGLGGTLNSTPQDSVELGSKPLNLSGLAARIKWGQDPFHPKLGQVEIDGREFYVARTVDGQEILGKPYGKDGFQATDPEGAFIGNYFQAADGRYFRGGLQGGAKLNVRDPQLQNPTFITKMQSIVPQKLQATETNFKALLSSAKQIETLNNNSNPFKHLWSGDARGGGHAQDFLGNTDPVVRILAAAGMSRSGWLDESKLIALKGQIQVPGSGGSGMVTKNATKPFDTFQDWAKTTDRTNWKTQTFSFLVPFSSQVGARGERHVQVVLQKIYYPGVDKVAGVTVKTLYPVT